MRALLLALLVLAPALAGCASEGARASLVPYPRLGDVVEYEASGALLDFARWQNGIPFVADPARVRYEVQAGQTVLDGARDLHDAFLVVQSVSEGGPFVERARRHVSSAHEAVVQAYYPLSQDQGVLAFDERGYPWLWGASQLFGEDLATGATFPFTLPDNLARGASHEFAWRVVGPESVDGVDATRLDLDGVGARASLWMEAGVAWPLRVEFALDGDALAPHVRNDGAPGSMLVASRASMAEGGDPVPPRSRGASFGSDAGVRLQAWDGEKPPDGDAGYVPYALADAVRDAKALDPALVQWLGAAGDPRVYRATHKIVPFGTDTTGPLMGTRAAYWLIQWVDADARYYQVEVERVDVEALGQGAPRIASSGPAEAPADENHGWFAAGDAPAEIVPLSEGARVVRDVFGATSIEIFLRSFLDPVGYSYYLDGGFLEGESGRYTVVYNPATGFMESATGYVPRVA